jgi:hypothetical protein
VAGWNGKGLVFGFVALIALAAAAAALAAPGPAWVRLDQGSVRSYSWSVDAADGAMGTSAAAPCLRVAITHRHGRFSYDRSRFRDCALSSRALARSRPPLLVGGTHLGNSGGSRMTVFGILAPAGARKIRVSVSDGARAESVAASLAAIPSTGRMGGLRFAVVILPGAHCVERLATASASGRSLWEGPPSEHGCE